MTDDEFYSLYEALAMEGKADPPGGSEYQRVRAEWVAEGRPEPSSVFMVLQANLPPSGTHGQPFSDGQFYSSYDALAIEGNVPTSSQTAAPPT